MPTGQEQAFHLQTEMDRLQNFCGRRTTRLTGDMLKFRQDDGKQCRETLILFFALRPNLEA